MRKLVILAAVLFSFALRAEAMDFTAPAAPDSVAQMVPEEADSFAQGLWNVVRAAIESMDGSLHEAGRACVGVGASVLLCAMARQAAPKMSVKSIDLACTAAVAGTLLSPSASLISLGTQTVESMSEYGKLLLPVMTGAMAAQGGTTSSAALYAGTAFFDSVLAVLIQKLMTPMLWIFLCLAIACSALGEQLLEKLKELVRWSMTWIIRAVLYLFTGYLTVTGVVSGSADAAALKAAKITISGAVPVVGGILSDASEAVLVSAGLMRSAAGIYGLLTILALMSAPIMRIGVQYLILKAVSAVCACFQRDGVGKLLGDFSAAMGLLMAMVCTQTVLLLISTVCLMKGVG